MDKSCIIHERSSDLSHNNLSVLEDPRPHLLPVSSSSNSNSSSSNSNNNSSVLLLMLGGNPLQCHCSLAWLQQLLAPRQEEEEERALIIQEQHNNNVNDS